METKKITPWLNWKEWRSVVDDAYNLENNVISYRRAFSTILAWEARDPNLPSGLLGLKELILAKLSKLSQNLSSIENIYAYQSSLAMSIVRFVNFLTEPYQTHSIAKPVKHIATSIGIPDWIVNIRHGATHFNLPSIELLEKAIDYLFAYLKERYVNTYKETSLEQSILQNVKSYIQHLFTDYMNIRYKLTVMKNKDNSLNDLSINLVEKIDEITVNFRNETFEILLDDGFMIPTKDQLNSMGIVAEEFLEQENLNIPKSFLNIWTQFLIQINEKNLMSLYFLHLLNTYKFESENVRYSDKENLRNKFLLSWILYLLKANSFKNEKLKNSKFQFHFSYKQVLYEVLGTRPNNYTFLFLKEISKIASFSNEIAESDYEKLKTLHSYITLTNLLQAESSCMLDGVDEMETSEIFYDLSIFEKAQKWSFTYEAQKPKQNHDWKMIDDPNWNYENLKLGYVEEQSDMNFNIDIEQFCDQTNEEPLKKPISTENISTEPLLNARKKQTTCEFNRENLQELKQKLANNYWEIMQSH